MFVYRCERMSDDLYFKGMFDNILKGKKQKNKQLVCSQCGSKQIYKVTLQEPVFVEVDISFKCENCGHIGKPKKIKSGEKKQNKTE